MLARLIPQLMKRHGYSRDEAEEHARRIAAAAGMRAHGKAAMESRAQAVRRAHAHASHAGAMAHGRRALNERRR
jgi:hypothetical protein